MAHAELLWVQKYARGSQKGEPSGRPSGRSGVTDVVEKDTTPGTALNRRVQYIRFATNVDTQ